MIRNALQRLMYGRYGNDQLNRSLIMAYLLLYLAFIFTRLALLYWVSVLLLCVTLFRMLSRNLERRRLENVRFLGLVGPIAHWFRFRRTMRRDKDHVYFKCPNCGQRLRVPRGMGKITVTCRSCGASFQEKS